MRSPDVNHRLPRPSPEGVLELIRQTAEGLADLLGKHLKLARLEFTGDLLKVASRARLILVLGALLAVGYALAMAGLAVCVGGNRAVGVSLLILGGVHLGPCSLGLRAVVRRLGGMQLMDDTSGEAQRSFATLGLRPAAAPPTSAPAGAAP
jgi:hypothetical protein